MTSPPRTVDDFAAPYVNVLVRVPPGGLGVCTVCHSIVSSRFEVCYRCKQAREAIGAQLADVTAFVSMAPTGEQFARDLYIYKNPSVRDLDRQTRTYGLAAVLWKWLNRHEACMTRRLGIREFDLITAVPSTSGRAVHPLRSVVAGIVVGSDNKYVDLLEVARTDLQQRAQAPDRYRARMALGGQSVLVIDDTWTTGAHAQSASAALKAAGAARVAVLAIGRWFDRSWNPDDENGEAWLAEHRQPGWDWNRCCLEA